MNVFKGKGLTTVSMPDTIETIGAFAFSMNEITSVELSKNIKDIGNMVFYSNKLTSVTIPSNWIRIPTATFGKNELTSVTIPEGVKAIAKQAFTDNKLESIDIPQSVGVIGSSAFANNQLKDVNISANVRTLEKGVFDGNADINLNYEKLINAIEMAESLDTSDKTQEGVDTLTIAINLAKQINNKSNASLAEVEDAVSQINLAIEELQDKDSEAKWSQQDFEYINTTITGFSNRGLEKFKTNKDVVLPSLNKDGQAITEIGDQAFLIADFSTKQDPQIGINSVKLPDTIKVIGREAFRFNALKSIDIPKGVTTIDLLAFNGNCLESLNLPNSVTNLGNGAFTMNEISKLTLSDSIEVIPPAFAFNKLTTLTIPKGVTKIEDLAFSDNELTEVNLPSTLKYLSGFNNNGFKTITIPKSVEELGFKAFASNKMTSVTIPGNVKVVGKRAFWNTWHDQLLSSLTIEEGVEELREFSFRDNELKDVNIPSSLKVLDKNTFGGNLGHDKVVHLYTPEFKNTNNLEDSKDKHVVNPAKVIVKYEFGDKKLKEEEYFKIDGNYLHIGDSDVKITPNYSDNKYELEDESVKTISLTDKENIVTFKCVEKDTVEDIKIKSIGVVGSAVVDIGTSKNLAMDRLPKKTFIIDTNEDKHEVLLSWTLDSYDQNKSGEYQAVGTFELPQGVVQSTPEMKLEVKSSIFVKEKLEDINWTKEDFIYEGTILKGLSDVGKEKIKTVKELVLPNDNPTGQAITHIGASAFKELDIEKVIVPKEISQIGAFAFSKNKLSYVDFPGTIERVENQAFGNNNLVDITFADGEGTICLDSMSFLENKLTDITIIKEIKKIHEDAFKNNLGHGDDNNKVHIYLSKVDPENNGLFENSAYHKIIELSKFELSEGTITGYTGTATDVKIPEVINGQTVTAIANNVFKDKGLTSVEIPNTVKTIGQAAFAMNELTEVKLPEQLNSLGNMAFFKNKLTSVSINDGLEVISTAAFGSNELTTVEIPESVTSIARQAFMNNKLETINIPTNINDIGASTFENNNLSEVIIPKSITNIAGKAFDGNINIKLKYVSLVEAIDRAEKVDITDKTEDSANVLKETIELGKTLNEKTNASLAEVNAIVIKINNAIEALESDSTIESYAV